MPSLNLTFAFTAGMLATINPCGWAMLPSFAAYYLGVEDDGYRERSWAERIREGVFFGGLIALGFITVFVVMGSVITFGLRMLVRYLPLGTVFVGALLTLLGVWMLLGGKLPFRLPTLTPQRARSPKAIYLFGVAYGLVSLSCTLPVFLAVVGVSIPQNSWLSIGVMFLTYAGGMAVVLMSVTLSLTMFKESVAQKARALLPYVHRLGAVLLIVAGLYLLWYQGRYLDIILAGL